MARKSKIESSDHYNEIMDMIKEGISSRDISKHLQNEYNESIHYNTINNYCNSIKSKTASEYYKAKKKKEKSKNKKVNEVIDKGVANKESFDDVVDKGVSDLNSLDNIISAGEHINLDVSGIVEQEGPRGGIIVSKFDVLKAHALVANVVIKAAKVKSDILKDEPEVPNVNVYVNEIAKDKNTLDKSKDFLDSIDPNNS